MPDREQQHVVSARVLVGESDYEDAQINTSGGMLWVTFDAGDLDSVAIPLAALPSQPTDDRLTEGEWWERFGEQVGEQVVARAAPSDDRVREAAEAVVQWWEIGPYGLSPKIAALRAALSSPAQPSDDRLRGAARELADAVASERAHHSSRTWSALAAVRAALSPAAEADQ